MPDHTAGVELSPGNSTAQGLGALETDRAAAPSASARDIAARRTVRGGPRWRMRNWRLRTKLVAVLLVPVLIALALAGLRAKSELDSAAVYEQTATDMQTVQDVVRLTNELQKERALVVSFVAANRSGDSARMQEQILR